ncbi:MAG TPA: hypothetical protein VMM15_02165 [Bradyrhizobium sp.]|nr:hypothetical protein [Bradyrhizobium sp.]
MRESPPEGDGWAYEIKADGYRAQVHLHEGEARAYSRMGHDWSEQFSTTVAAAQKLEVQKRCH